jgi:predicted AAA+ superfamily ATPase
MHYISRNMESILLALAKSYPVITLLGPRQSGKTTLVKHCFKDKPYVSLENLDTRAFAELDPRAFLGRYPNGAIFDEIQRVPSLLSYIQGAVDEHNEKGQYILTGSHQHSLHASISQSLAGRTVILKLLPLSYSELFQQHETIDINALLYQGFYPRIYQDKLNPIHFYNSYLQTYIERDLRQMINVKDLSVFQHFIKLCASRIGQIFNANSISNDLGISVHTVQQWLSILEASFVVFRLQPYFENFGKRIIKSPKLYFIDVGLAAYCLGINDLNQIDRDPLRGNLVENFVIAEILKRQYNQGLEPNLYFYRDSNQREVDLVIKRGHELYPVEIKSSQTFNPNFLDGIKYFQTLVNPRAPKGYLVYTGQEEQQINTISVINYRHLNSI